MKKVLLVLSLFILLTDSVYAQRGCCSGHDGVVGCSSNGKQLCGDGTTSPSCTCTPDYIYGCTDRNATNYNSSANKDDGSCRYPEPVYGCTDNKATNYNVLAEKDDGSCVYPEPSPSPSPSETPKTISTPKANSATTKNEEDDNNAFASGVGILALAGGGYYIYKKKRG